MESKRSVTPNGTLLNARRKQKGFTVEQLSHIANVGLRTAQKAIAGKSVDIETLRRIADALEEPYESLLIQDSEAKDIKLQLEISLSADDPAKIQEVIGILQRLLSVNVVLLAAGAGVITVGIGEAKGSTNDVKQAITRLGARLRFAYPLYITLLDGERYNYRSEGYWHYCRCRQPDDRKSMDELSIAELLRNSLAHQECQHGTAIEADIDRSIPLSIQYAEARKLYDTCYVNGVLKTDTPEMRYRHEYSWKRCWDLKWLDCFEQTQEILKQVSFFT